MSSSEFSLVVPAAPANLAMIRDFVCGVGLQAGFSTTQVNRLELAVDEACSNVIEHGNSSDASKMVTLKASYDADSVRIAIIDSGAHFDPQKAPVKSLEVRKLERRRRQPVRGLGIPMLRSLIDQIDYHVLPDNRNELELVLRKG